MIRRWWRDRATRARAGHVPTQFNDPAVAAIRDPAVQVVVAELTGHVAQLRGQVAALENQVRELTDRLPWTVLKPDNPYDRNAVMARGIVHREQVAPSWADVVADEGNGPQGL